MSKLDLAIYPARVLRRQAKLVKNVDAGLIKTADEMFALMYENNGIGLAGPQVGLSKRILVIDLRQDNHPVYVMINPRVTKRDGEIEIEEGCLSLPDVFGEVKRAERVQVSYVDRNGEEQTLEAEGLLARAIQHEIDHLNGVLFIDRLGETRRQLLEQQLRALAESAEGKIRENGC
ncbi:MAG: peptide deformylase [Candidatus Hydrogenedentota bacterium]|nr:MAG: peptide deformylase [Candidatus Hydrogenedentota bacterium]